jgi:hypothetical protein
MSLKISKSIFLLFLIFVSTCAREKSKSLETKVIDKIHELNGSDKDPESFAAPEDEPPYLYPPKLKLVTQSMGTTGAEDYIVKSGISLLEIDGINYVDYDFNMGDHAYPGTFSRAGYEAREE